MLHVSFVDSDQRFSASLILALPEINKVCKH